MDIPVTPNSVNNGYNPDNPCLALKNSHLLSGLSNEQLDRVCQHAKVIKLKDGESLFTQGSDVISFYLVKTGSLKLFRLSQEGHEKIIDIASDGKMIAEALMFMDHAKYPVSVSALSKSEVIAIDAVDFTAMLRGSMDTCFLLLANLSMRLHSLINEIDILSLNTGTCRVVSYLLEKAPADKNTFKLDNSKRVIAARISVKPETFSRILKELHQKGLLTVDSSQITIHDRQALKEISTNQNCYTGTTN